MKKEIFKSIPCYEGLYEVSDLATVKSLERKGWMKRNNCSRVFKEKILIPALDDGYYKVSLYKKGKRKTFKVSVLVMMAFKDHKPNGNQIVVDHKDNIRSHDYLSNLQLITQRENCSKDRRGGSSKNTGVSWNKLANKWHSSIKINGKKKHLGSFDSETEASFAYQKSLRQLLKN